MTIYRFLPEAPPLTLIKRIGKYGEKGLFMWEKDDGTIGFAVLSMKCVEKDE